MSTYLGPSAIVQKANLDKAPKLSRYGRFVLERQAPAAFDSYSAVSAPLVDRGLARDGMILAPFILPSRAAAWWVCLCVRQGLSAAPAGADYWALRETVLWARTPTKEQHERLQALVNACERKSIAWYCARGTMFGGWMKPDQSGFEAGKPMHAARSWLAAVYLTLKSAPRRGIPVSARQFVAFADDVEGRRAPWHPTK